MREYSRPSSISNFNCGFICEHLLFVQYKTNKQVCAFQNDFFAHFQNFTKIKTFKTQIFEILVIYKPSLGSREVPHVG